jgi:hypothetical protein
LLARLNEIKGNNFIAGDFGNYDGSILAQLIQRVTQIINDVYDGSESDNLVREVLMEDVCNAIHIDRCTLYRVFRGNPSGNPLTTVMNSLVNMMLMLYAWLSCGYTLEQYGDFVRAMNFGDDNVLKVHPHAERYTMQSIAASLRPIGITYTPASKNGVEYSYIGLSDVTFLKRKFVQRRDGIVYAPLDPVSRDEMLYWYRDGNDKTETMRSIARSHMVEAVHYGPEFYNKRARELVGELAKIGIVMPELAKTHAEWVDEWYNDVYEAPTDFVAAPPGFQGMELQSLGVEDWSEPELEAVESDCETAADVRSLDIEIRRIQICDAMLWSLYSGYVSGVYPEFLEDFIAIIRSTDLMRYCCEAAGDDDIYASTDSSMDTLHEVLQRIIEAASEERLLTMDELFDGYRVRFWEGVSSRYWC